VLYVSDFDRGVVLRVGVNGATAVVATLQHPAGLAVDRAGVVYVGDTATHTVRRIEGASTRVVATVTSPTGLAFDAQGTLHVADGNGGGVFRFPLTGALAPLLVEARDVAVGGATVYTTDGTLLRRFTATTMSVIAGHGERWHGDGGPATEARLWDPRGLALDAAGNLYIADSGNHRVRRVDARGVISTFATSKSPRALGFDAVGDLLVDGQRVTPLARIVAAGDVLQRADGSRYVADLETDRVYLRTPVAAVKQLPALAPGMLLEVDTAQEVSFNGLAARVAAVGFVVVPESLMPGPVDVLLGSVKVAAVVVAAAPRLFAAVGEADVIERGALMTLYGTGQGVEPLPVRVRVGVYDAEVLYSGPVAGYPGLWQVNARVPAGFLAPGLLPVTVTVGEAVSAALLVDVR
jgi:sugar lactone lactonase YvrE